MRRGTFRTCRWMQHCGNVSLNNNNWADCCRYRYYLLCVLHCRRRRSRHCCRDITDIVAIKPNNVDSVHQFRRHCPAIVSGVISVTFIAGGENWSVTTLFRPRVAFNLSWFYFVCCWRGKCWCSRSPGSTNVSSSCKFSRKAWTGRERERQRDSSSLWFREEGYFNRLFCKYFASFLLQTPTQHLNLSTLLSRHLASSQLKLNNLRTS